MEKYPDKDFLPETETVKTLFHITASAILLDPGNIRTTMTFWKHYFRNNAKRCFPESRTI